MRKNKKAFLPIVVLFIVLNGFFITGKSLLERWQADQEVLLIGNLLLFVITFISFVIAERGLHNKNPHAFVRSAYSSIILKLFICIIAALIYIATFRKNLNKPAFFTLMGLYLLYTFIEVSQLTRLLRKQPNE